MPDSAHFPEGFSVDAVDWLPSGARSGLVRVRGHRPPAVSGPLPELILEAGGETKRFVSLPDPRADRDPAAWRGAYVLEARPAAEADRLWLEWPGQRRIPLPPLSVPAAQVVRGEEPAEPTGGDVVDRAVLADRRARRAEAAEQAQARIAREALRAVEVLELRVSELEGELAAAGGEAETRRAQAVEAGAEPDVRLEIMHAEVRELRAALAEAQAAEVASPIGGGDAERRAERLRGALTTTVATVAELRQRLHESDVARRTRDVARAADAVRLAVVERERTAMLAELEQAREGLREARLARDEATAELGGVRAAHEDMQARHREVTAELGAARERMAELEAELAAVAAEAERAATDAADAARAEETLGELQSRLARLEAELVEAETARELAEAAALAATAERRAASVAHAAGATSSPRGRDVDHFATTTPRDAEPEAPSQTTDELDIVAARAPSAADDLVAAAAEQERRATAHQPATDANLVADLDKAREKLRPTIISAASEPPADVARGRGNREYPPLRGALVKLAHDDPKAAGLMLAGLLSAQRAVLDDPPPDYDLTIEEVGTFAVCSAGQSTLVNPLHAPRGRDAAFHLRVDALTFAEIVAGVEQRPRRRRGPLRASGKVRQARRLTDDLRGDASLGDLVRAGADVDPELILRGLAYAIRPAWTKGQRWAVELHVDDRPVSVAAQHSGGLTVTDGPHEAEPDARIRMSMADFKALVAGEEPALSTEGDEAVVRRLLSLAERARSGSE